MDENKTYGTRLTRLWKLFLSTLYISSFTFGGGFVIVTFMKKKFVDELHWIDEQEMLDMTALAQSSPGAIAVNAAILVGWQVEGLIGMIVAVLGTIIPPMVILSVISVFYNAFATNRYIALVVRGIAGIDHGGHGRHLTLHIIKRRETGIGNGSHFGWPGGHYSGIGAGRLRRILLC